jgi:hypothetical protein
MYRSNDSATGRNLRTDSNTAPYRRICAPAQSSIRPFHAPCSRMLASA